MKKLKAFFNNLKGYFAARKQLRSEEDIIFSFYGFNHYTHAIRYADLRRDRNGKQHWVLPAGAKSEQLIVFNSDEKKQLQRLGLMSKRVTIKMLMEAAYYKSDKGGWGPVASGKTKNK